MLDTTLLNTIENEINQTSKNIYEKIIPINMYTLKTKKTLDFIIDKYGGYIKRYNDKIIIYIKPNINNKPIVINNSQKFTSINESLKNLDNRLTIVEKKLNKIINKTNTEKKNIHTYLKFFRNEKNNKEIHKLIEEIIHHH